MPPIVRLIHPRKLALVAAVLLASPLPTKAAVLVSENNTASVLAQKGNDESRPGASKSFFSREGEGWFFYKDPRDAEPAPAQKLDPIETDSASKKTKEMPAVGSVAWIRDNIDRIRDAAIDHPTHDNLELFGYVQKLMMDKSQLFSQGFVQTTRSNPALDETAQTPVASAARMLVDQEREKAQSEVLTELGGSTAIWYFFRSDCPYCRQQDLTLETLARRFGFAILPISLDGASLVDGSFPEWVPDKGQSGYLNVQATPTLYMVRPPNQLVLLSVGLHSMPELTTRILEVAKETKWITDEQFDRASQGLVRRFLTDGFDPSTISDPNDPAQLLEAFRASGTYSTRKADIHELDQALDGTASPWKK